MSEEDSIIAWVDVETTGLDPHREHLLEVACLLTDPRGAELGDGHEFHKTVHYTPGQVAAMRDAADPYVRDMHDRTGLWQRLPEGDPVATVDAALKAFIVEYAPDPKQARIGGNSVRLDAGFLDVNLPVTAAHLHYRVVDVSTFAFVLYENGFVPHMFEKRRTHAALDDIRESLAEYRWLLDRYRY